jgi:hypothetical protein
MLFILGVAMMVSGVAFCLLGAVKLPGGRLLKAKYAQTCGVVMLGYFPLVFVLQRWLGQFEDVTNYLTIVYCLLLVMCLGVCWVIVLRTTSPARQARKYSASVPAASPLLQDQPLINTPSLKQQAIPGDLVGEAKPASPAPTKNKNMFDFS